MTKLSKKDMKKIDSFVDHVKNKTKEHGIDLRLKKTKRVFVVGDECGCSGFFDDVAQELVCAIKKPIELWLPVLVHEYSHMEQWIEQCRSWIRLDHPDMENAEDIFAWICGKKVPFNKIKTYVSGTISLELDCEKRTVENVKKFDLPLNIEECIQKANAYVYFYRFVLERRQWYGAGKAPYEIPEVYKQMPTHFLKRYDRLPKKYLKLYDEYC